jgi:iron complex outermembrane receptor protein
MAHNFRRARLLGSTTLLGLSLAGFAAGSAQAQTATPGAGQAAAQEVVVTGSRIPRAGFDTLQPAETVSAQTFEDRGFTNAGDALNELPAFGAQQNSGQQTGSNVGQQFVNLYGLGSQRTLVLVDGRRFVSGNAPKPAGTFGGPPPGQEVDLNDIPVGMIDHIEVLSVGGAPVYGADAIAGTVNIILKKNFQGADVEAQYGISDHSDGQSYVGRALLGTNFADDRGNVTVSVEYTQQDGITQADRPKTDPYATFQPSDACTAQGFGACYVPNAHVASITTGGIPGLNAGLVNTGGSNYPSAIHNAAGQVVAFAPDGSLQPVDLGIQNNGSVFSQGGTTDYLANQNQLIAPVKRVLVDTLGHFDFTPHITGYLETEFSHSDGTQLAAQPSYQSALFASQNGEAPIPFSINNPFLSPQARSILVANGVTNTFFLSRANLDLAPQTFENDIDTYRIVAGFKGDVTAFDRKIHWDTSFNYGSSQGEETYYDINEANFLNAINVVTNPANGQVTCAVSLAPPPLPANGVQPTSVTGCQPLNLFGAGAPSAAARAFVTAKDHAESLLTQRDVQINVNGSPFDIWAGPVQVAAGFEYRQETGSYNVDAFAQSGLGRDAPTSDVSGEYDSKELYIEGTIPLVSPKMGIPFVYSGEFDASYRRIDNSLAGDSNVFTLGAKFAPVRDIEFRGNLTHSVRAPSIEELFLPTTSTESFAQDPCDPNYINGQANRVANCQKAFAGSTVPLSAFKSNVVNASVLGSTGGNSNLLNERSNAWTAGFIARPRWIPHLTVALDWINIHLKDPITALTLTQVMDACYDTPTFGNSFCSLFSRNSAGQVTNYQLPLSNIGAQEFDGAQLDATYAIAVNEIPFINRVGLNPSNDYGALTFDLNGFFENKHNEEILGVITKLRGNIGDPKWKVNGSVRYRYGPAMVYLNGRYISSGDEDVTLQRSSQSIFGVGNYWEWNGAISYDVTSRITAEISVNNLFDQDPPKYASALNGNAALSTYDYFGRAYVFHLRSKF